MAATTDNTTTAAQEGAPLPATHRKIRDPQSIITLTTLGGRASSAPVDGHAVPSISDATPLASMKLGKLMDTESHVTSACNMSRLPAGRLPWQGQAGFERPSWLLHTQSCADRLRSVARRERALLARYTCRARKGLFSCRINEITKTKSIHFQGVLEPSVCPDFSYSEPSWASDFEAQTDTAAGSALDEAPAASLPLPELPSPARLRRTRSSG